MLLFLPLSSTQTKATLPHDLFSFFTSAHYSLHSLPSSLPHFFILSLSLSSLTRILSHSSLYSPHSLPPSFSLPSSPTRILSISFSRFLHPSPFLLQSFLIFSPIVPSPPTLLSSHTHPFHSPIHSLPCTPNSLSHVGTFHLPHPLIFPPTP